MIERARAALEAEAERRGLRRLAVPDYGRIWIEAGSPTRFFVERYRQDGELELVEHQIRFPIRDLADLTEALKALDALYFGAENVVSYMRHGSEGLIEFLEALQAGVELQAAAQPDEASGGTSLTCPTCMAGTIVEVHIAALDMDAFMCEACEALWLRYEEISETGAITYETLMEGLGQPADRTAITVNRPIEAK